MTDNVSLNQGTMPGSDKEGIEGGIASLHGYGDYTHWKPLK